MMASSETLAAELISFYRNTREAQSNHAESEKEAELRAQIQQKQTFLQSLKRLVSGMNNLYHGIQAGNEESVRGRQIIKESNTIAQRLIENYNSQLELTWQMRTNRLLSDCDGDRERRAQQKMARMLEVVRVQEQVIAELRSSRRLMEVEKSKQMALTLQQEIADIDRDFVRAKQEYRQEEDRICRTLADLCASIGEEMLRRQELNAMPIDPKQQQQQQQQQHQQLENGGCSDPAFSEVIDAIVNTHEGENGSLQHEGEVSLMLLNESTSKYSFELEFKNPNDFPDLLKIMQPASTSYEKMVKKCEQSADTTQNRTKKNQSKKQSRISGQQEKVGNGRSAEPPKKKQKQNDFKAQSGAGSTKEALEGQNDQENHRPLAGEKIASSLKTPAKSSNRLVKTQDSNVGENHQQDQRTLRKRKALEPAMERSQAAQIPRKESKQKTAPAVTTAKPDSIFKEPLPVASFTASGSKRKPKSQAIVQKVPVKKPARVDEVIKQDRPMKPANVAEVQHEEDFLSPKKRSSSQFALQGTSNRAMVQDEEVFLSPDNVPSKDTPSDTPPENLLESDEQHPMGETQNSNSSIIMEESMSSGSMDFMLPSSSAMLEEKELLGVVKRMILTNRSSRLVLISLSTTVCLLSNWISRICSKEKEEIVNRC
ncbi:hypothetical protein AND_007477 [Anopheles darlingi]|uniref:Uncharacterized protein n=1 Tax=Anopheles darlingi TaxID=43151 RepID=W5JDJ8_ANODA|nr:hypothetical protein AND_007477 [Anopheles darlingi]